MYHMFSSVPVVSKISYMLYLFISMYIYLFIQRITFINIERDIIESIYMYITCIIHFNDIKYIMCFICIIYVVYFIFSFFVFVYIKNLFLYQMLNISYMSFLS
jgi:hypothetical protein